MNKENLLILADYLESLPADYKHFGMELYINLVTPADRKQYALRNGGLEKYGCGTVACAVGHGPSAGFLFLEDEIDSFDEPKWFQYCERVFGIEPYSYLFDFMFGSEWESVDDTHYGAAARIRYTRDYESVPIEINEYESVHIVLDPTIYADYHKDNRKTVD